MPNRCLKCGKILDGSNICPVCGSGVDNVDKHKGVSEKLFVVIVERYIRIKVRYVLYVEQKIRSVFLILVLAYIEMLLGIARIAEKTPDRGRKLLRMWLRETKYV